MKEMKFTHLHDLNTFSCSDNEVYLSGLDEHGHPKTVVFSAFEFLSWIDKQAIDHIKEQTIKHIKEL
tara:strand:- start:79 stop:279 length:201 start_codon:yes stop_codon:yes gene_type:complete